VDTFLREGPWWSAASVAGLVVVLAAFHRGRGTLRLNPYGLTVTRHGRRRTYAWRDLEVVGPMVIRRHPGVVVEVGGARGRRRIALETYGRTAGELSRLLEAYRAQAVAADTGGRRTTRDQRRGALPRTPDPRPGVPGRAPVST
jgi:hypothetical protein